MKHHPLLAQTHEHLRARQYSKRTEEGYLYWIRYFLRFHQGKAGAALVDDDVRQFLAFLALERKVSPSTQATALNALNYLYRQVLGRETMDVADFTRAPARQKLPVVLSRDEVRRLLAQLDGHHRTCATASPPTCWSGARTFAPCRSNSATAMCALPRSIPTCSIGAGGPCAVR